MKCEQFVIVTVSTVQTWLVFCFLFLEGGGKKDKFDSFLLYSVCGFMLWRHQEIGVILRSEDGELERNWFKNILSIFIFLVKWRNQNVKRTFFNSYAPFSQGVPQFSSHNLLQSADIWCLQSAVLPYQLLSAVTVLPTDLPH